MPLYSVYKLPHRAQVRLTILTVIPLKVRQGTVFLTLGLIQTLHAPNDKENCMNF